MILKEKIKRLLIFTSAILLVALIGYFDYITGYQIGFSLLYLIPIVLVVWQVGRYSGILVSLTSSIAIFVADIVSGNTYSHFLIRYWNCLMTFCFFLIITILLDILKERLEYEKTLARIDPLTLIPNRRHFFDSATVAINQLQRYGHPFTIAYIDCDNFKLVNDTYGHNAGDTLLRNVARIININIRISDTVARLGGDEFGVLMPETSQTAGSEFISRLHDLLLKMVAEENWPVTFSIGIVTYLTAPKTVEEMIDRADKMMYSVKADGKNLLKAEIFKDDNAERQSKEISKTPIFV